jgi:hypothetical protein
MSNLWESAICNEYALKYVKYAKYVNKNTICRMHSHFADDIPYIYIYIHGKFMDIPCLSTQYIHGISMDMHGISFDV